MVIDFSGPDRHAILVGPNAGGKTLLMKSLAMFSDAMARPTKRKLTSLDRLVREAEIEMMSVEFKYDFMNEVDGKKSEDGNESRVPWISLKRKHSQSDRIDIDWTATYWSDIYPEEESSPPDSGGTTIEGRVSVEYGLYLDKKRGPMVRRTEGIGFKIIPALRWGDIRPEILDGGGHDFHFPSIPTQARGLLEWPLVEGFRSFGSPDPWGASWRRDAEVIAGLRFRRFDDVSARNFGTKYEYYNINRMIRFNANIPQFHKISDAYDFHTESKEPIRLLFDEENSRIDTDLFKERYLSLLRKKFTDDFVRKEVYDHILLEDMFAEEGKEDMSEDDWTELKKRANDEFIQMTHNQKMALLHRYARRHGAADDKTKIVDEQQFRERMAVTHTRNYFIFGTFLNPDIMVTGQEERGVQIKSIADYNHHDPDSCPIPTGVSEITDATKSRICKENRTV